MEKPVRRSVKLPGRLVGQVRSTVENRKRQEFFDLAERFRNQNDPEAAKRLGDQLGRMVFGT